MALESSEIAIDDEESPVEEQVPEGGSIEERPSAEGSFEGDSSIEDEALQSELSEEERERLEHDALVAVFKDVRSESRHGRLSSPERWEQIGLVPAHMTSEDLEMAVYDFLQERLEAEAREEKEAEPAPVYRTATRCVGVPRAFDPVARAEDEQKAREEAAKLEAASDGELDDGGDAEAAAGDKPAEAAAVAGAALAGEAAGSDASAEAAGGKDPRDAATRTALGGAAEQLGGLDGSAAEAGDAPARSDPDIEAKIAEASARLARVVEGDRQLREEDEEEIDAGDFEPFEMTVKGVRGRVMLVDGEPAFVPYAPGEGESEEIDCSNIKLLMGRSSYYLYAGDLMTDTFAAWALMGLEADDVVTLATLAREESRIYPRPLLAASLENRPFYLDKERIEAAWKTIQESGDYPDIQETFASNGDRYFFSTDHMSKRYADSLAEWNSVERVRNV